MQLLQHVYGRVSRGVKPGAAGYQLAAVSAVLAARSNVVACLNRMSFYRYRAAGAGPIRWSFFRPEPGLLAFGQVRMTTDLTGAAASFAHHFVAEEREFSLTGWTPTQILHAVPFLTGERDLPEDRNLPAYALPEHPPDAPTETLRDEALALLDRVLGEDRLRVPMVIAPDEGLWAVLEEMYRLLPRAESAQVTFSTLFGQSAEFVESFRVVSVPDRAQAQRMPDVFEPLDRGDLRPVGAAHPLSTFWRTQPARGAALRDFVDALRLEKHASPSHLRHLLQAGPPFRAVIEALEVPGVFDLLLDEVNDLTAYAKSGPALTLEHLREAMWRKPRERLAVVLGFAKDNRAVALLDDVLADAGLHMIDDASLFATIERAGCVADFYRVCTTKLDGHEIQAIAGSLHGTSGYQGELHRVVVRQVMEHGGDSHTWTWLRRQQTAVTVARAAVAAYDALGDRLPWLPDIEKFTLSPEEVAALTRWAWHEAGQARVADTDRISALFTSAGREVFYRLLGERLGELGSDETADCLAAVVRHRNFVGGDEPRLLRQVGTDRRLAAALLARLEVTRRGSPEFRERLAEVARKNEKKGWMSWLGR